VAMPGQNAMEFIGSDSVSTILDAFRLNKQIQKAEVGALQVAGMENGKAWSDARIYDGSLIKDEAFTRYGRSWCMQKGMEIERGLSGAGLRKYFDHFQEMTVAHVRYSRIKTTDLATTLITQTQPELKLLKCTVCF
jgi:hypothetical protein